MSTKKIICIAALLVGHLAEGQNIPSGGSSPLIPSFGLAPLPASYAPSGSGLNFVRTFIPFTSYDAIGPMFTRLANPADVLSFACRVTTSYQNGWGGEIQTIARGGPGAPDVLQPNDSRPALEHENYLPYPLALSSQFQITPFLDQRAYYAGAYPAEIFFSYGQSITSYPSLTPTQSTYAPGSSLTGNRFGTTVSETINDGTEDIIVYPVVGSSPAYYLAGQLSVKTTIDHDGSKSIEYFDKNGREVCKKIWATNLASSGSDWLTTYYVYNDLGQLIQILTPAASWHLNSDPTYDISHLNYSYEYNSFGSPVTQTVPGKAGSEHIVYDSRNRPVLYQSPLLRSLGKYKFTIYDNRDRVALSGFFSDANDYAYWQAQIYSPTPPLFIGSLLSFFITGVSGAYPTTIPGCEIEQVNYYDTYPFTRAFDPGFVGLDGGYFSDGIEPYNVTQGLLTMSLSRVRDGGVGPSSDLWVCSVNFYDQKGRLIQTQGINPWHAQTYAACMAGAPSAVWDMHTIRYTFSGQPEGDFLRYTDLPTSDKVTTTIAVNKMLDAPNGLRLIRTRHRLDGAGFVDINNFTYDDLGRVKTKKLGNVETQTYDYNIRGQLTGINSGYVDNPCSVSNVTFGCTLNYDYGFTQPRFDGSLSGLIWRGADHNSPMRAYGYGYDPSGKLVNAEFRQFCDPLLNTKSCYVSSGTETWNKNKTDFTVSDLRYDHNGNIQSMMQRGTTATGPVLMDNLTYSYFPGSDQLMAVADGVTVDYHLGDFLDNTGADPAVDYAYDPDGNLSEDNNKRISSITYNESDQPLSVNYSDGSTISNMYTADGTLIAKTISPAGGSAIVYHYWGPFVYKSSSPTGPFSLQYVSHEDGRARYNSSTGFFTYDYYVKDHLGNVRTVVTGNETNRAPGFVLTTTSGGTPVCSGGGESEGGGGAVSMPGAGSVDSSTTVSYVATHEIAAGGLESAVFSNIDSVRDYKPATADSSDVMAARLNASESQRIIGTAIMLKVMAGDQFDFSTQSYWTTYDSASSPIPSSSLLSSIISALTNAQGNINLAENTGTQLVSDAFTPGNFEAFQSVVASETDPSVPQAYVYYMLFDEQMNLIPDQSGAVQIGPTPGTWVPISSSGPHTISSSGYLTVFVGTTYPGDVFIDPIVIGLSSGPLIQEQHYYPFGLAINEGESSSVIKNKFKYQGKELMDDLKLNLYDFTARQYDPQIGRFWGIDPASQFPSGYTGMGNDPANSIDPTGCSTDTHQNYVGNAHVLGYDAPVSGCPGGSPDVYSMMENSMQNLDQEVEAMCNAKQDRINKMLGIVADLLASTPKISDFSSGGLNWMWHELDKPTLLSFCGVISGLSGGSLQNFTGEAFEHTFNLFMEANNDGWGYQPNGEQSRIRFPTTVNGRGAVIPDGIENAEVVSDGGIVTIPMVSWYEAKATSSTITSGSFNYQAQGLVDALRTFNPDAAAKGWSSLIFATTSDAMVSPNFVSSMKDMYNVSVGQFISYYRQASDGIQVTFAPTTTPRYEIQYFCPLRPYVYLTPMQR